MTMKKSVLAVLVLGASLAVTGCFDKQETAQKVEAAKDATANAATQVKDAAKEVATDVKNAAIDAKDSAANKMAETKEAVADKASEMKDAAADKMAEAKEAMSSKMEEAKNSASETKEAVADKVSEMKDAAADKMAEAKEAMSSKMEAAKNSASETNLVGFFFLEQYEMLCAIYKSKRKPGCYLYISKRDDFSAVPDILMQSFGKPQFLMPFNLRGSKPLVHADKDEVMEKITQQGFYLQMPKQDDGLFNSLSEIK